MRGILRIRCAVDSPVQECPSINSEVLTEQKDRGRPCSEDANWRLEASLTQVKYPYDQGSQTGKVRVESTKTQVISTSLYIATAYAKRSTSLMHLFLKLYDRTGKTNGN